MTKRKTTTEAKTKSATEAKAKSTTEAKANATPSTEAAVTAERTGPPTGDAPPAAAPTWLINQLFPPAAPAPEPAATPPAGVAPPPATNAGQPDPTLRASPPHWDAQYERLKETAWERVAKAMEAARGMASSAARNDREAHSASADGRSPEYVAGHIRQSLEFRQAALGYLDDALREWQKWYPRDPFPEGDPDALRAALGGPLVPTPLYEARFRLTGRSPSWQSLGLYGTATAARAALDKAFGDRSEAAPWDVVHFHIKKLTDDSVDGLLDAQY